VTNAEARFSNSLRPRKPEGSLGRTAQDVHLDSHTAPELSISCVDINLYIPQKTLDYCVFIHGAKHVLGENENNNKMQSLMYFGFQRHHEFYE